MPDAFDEHGNPINRQDCLTVCPVAHIAEAREIALWHCKNVENQVLVTLEQMIPTALAPIGETTPTHYACPRSIFPAAGNVTHMIVYGVVSPETKVKRK